MPVYITHSHYVLRTHIYYDTRLFKSNAPPPKSTRGPCHASCSALVQCLGITYTFTYITPTHYVLRTHMKRS